MSLKRPGARILIVLLSILVVFSIAVIGCGEEKTEETTTEEKEEYKIGAVLSTSGGAAPLGEPEQRSLLLLEKQINDEGGVNGHNVKFIIEDDQSKEENAATAIDKLITTENVSAVIGSSTTGATLAMTGIAAEKGVPLVCCAAGTKITQDPATKKWVFRTPPTDSMAIEKVIEYLTSNLKVKNIAILHDQNAFGTGGADELEQKAPDAGLTVVARESYGTQDTDMTGQLTKIAETDAQALVVWGTNPGPASIANNMMNMGIDIPFVGSHGIANKKFIEIAGDAADGVVFPAGRLLMPSSIENEEWRTAVEDFASAYKSEYDMDIDTFAAHGYDAGGLIINAMKNADSNDPSKIRDALEETTDYVGIDGIYNYSPDDHDGLTSDDLIMIKIVNGEWEYHGEEEQPVN